MGLAQLGKGSDMNLQSAEVRKCEKWEVSFSTRLLYLESTSLSDSFTVNLWLLELA